MVLADRFVGSQAQDFKVSLLKLRSKGYDGLGVLLAPGQIAGFYRQALALKARVPTFGTHYFDNRAEIERSGEGIEGAVFASLDVTENFRGSYKRRFGNEDRIAFAGNGYDFAVLAGKLFGKLAARPSAAEGMRLFGGASAPPG